MSPKNKIKLNLLRKKLDKLDYQLLKTIKLRTEIVKKSEEKQDKKNQQEKEEKEEPKEKKWCHCKAYAQLSPDSAGTSYRSWERYECGTPEPPACTKPPTEGGLRTGRIIEPELHKKERLKGSEGTHTTKRR